jgi:hypothetical protein
LIYFNSTPEFRLLQKNDGLQILQVRYINQAQGYTGLWQNVPVIKEDDVDSQPLPQRNL